MERLQALFYDVDEVITRWMARHGVLLLRLSLGIVFSWFDVLKFFPDMSPAEELATRTIHQLTLGLISEDVALMILATWECLIGLGLLLGIFLRVTLFLLFVQMLGTITPIFFFPNDVFVRFPYAPTLEGQYIVKSLVLISAGIVTGSTVRGGGVAAEPEVVQRDKRSKNS
jgi:uncharacterized membrane protein YphA (DoxX/SURF4 family)